MFKKATLAKFEWAGLPDRLTELFVENLIFESSTENFVVTYVPNTDKEYWSVFNVLEDREEPYGFATQVQVTTARGNTYSTKDFVLFSEFKQFTTPLSLYVRAHTAIIQNINLALIQHIDASKLVAHVYANSKDEADELTKLYADFAGIKVLKQPKTKFDDMRRGVDFVQFEITPRTEELENLKHEIENDLWRRLAIYTGVELSHVTDHNIKDCEQAHDLMNAYELKRREDFCKRYNAWLHKHGDTRTLSVKIHAVTSENTVAEKDTVKEVKAE